MDNTTMARLLEETADLMEIDGADSFRIRSYRRAAEAAEQTTVDLVEAASDTARLLEIDGIGKSMAANLQAIAATGTLPQRDELLAKYGAGVLELLKLPGMGPKDGGAAVGCGAQIGSIDQLAEAIDAGRLAGLPRMGDKQIEKLRKGIEDYRRSVGRFRIDVAEEEARAHRAYLLKFKGIEKVTPAGSLRRGTRNRGRPGPAGDRTGLRAGKDGRGGGVCRRLSRHSRHDRQGREQGELPRRRRACRWTCGCCLRPAYGAALQYFTGSKAHNVTLRQRALKMGYTLSEWALARLDDESHRGRGDRGRDLRGAGDGLDAAGDAREPGRDRGRGATTSCRGWSRSSDIRGDVHMHTTASDGRNSIGEMAEAALACGYQYIAITDHSKNLAMTNGLDEKRALEQIKQVREVDSADERSDPRLYRHRSGHSGRRRAGPGR